MVCKTCGGDGGPSNIALPLSNPPSTTCSSCAKPTAECGCEVFCEEDHTATTICKRYGFTLRAKASFVWPAIDETVTLIVEGVDRLSPGSVIWNPTAGYLHVESFDFANQTIVAKNQGESCNVYTGGETLPECTDFIVGPPTCGTGPTPLPNIPYLAADFIAPADATCALASVTNIIGLVINDTVSMNGYEYTIGNVIDSSTIRLCNAGGGAPTGTVIEWDDDGDDIPNIPILVTASENPCTRDPSNAGILLVCDGTNVSKPLLGSLTGQIPVWNHIFQVFELKNIAAPYTTCTSLLADFTVDPGHVGSYVVSVVNTTGFLVGSTILIDSLFYTVNVVDNINTLHITPFETPLAIATYNVGFPVCLFFDQTAATLVTSSQLVQSAVTGITDSENAETAPITLNITNTSPVRQMRTTLYWFGFFHWISAGLFSGGLLQYDILASINLGAYASLIPLPAPANESWANQPGTRYRNDLVQVTEHLIAPGDTLIASLKAKIAFTAAANPAMTSASLVAQLKHVSVAV